MRARFGRRASSGRKIENFKDADLAAQGKGQHRSGGDAMTGLEDALAIDPQPPFRDEALCGAARFHEPQPAQQRVDAELVVLQRLKSLSASAKALPGLGARARRLGSARRFFLRCPFHS